METYYPAHHRVLAPKSIGAILERYAKHTFNQLSTKMFDLNGASTPLITLIIMPAYVSAATAFFGENFPAAKTYEDFATFTDSFHIMVADFPHFLTAGPRKRWDNVIGVFEQYLQDLRKSGDFPELVDMTIGIGDHAGWVSTLSFGI